MNVREKRHLVGPGWRSEFSVEKSAARCRTMSGGLDNPAPTQPSPLSAAPMPSPPSHCGPPSKALCCALWEPGLCGNKIPPTHTPNSLCLLTVCPVLTEYNPYLPFLSSLLLPCLLEWVGGNFSLHHLSCTVPGQNHAPPASCESFSPALVISAAPNPA